MLAAAVILCCKKWGSWELSQDCNSDGRGVRQPWGRGSCRPPLRLGRLPCQACSQEGKSAVVAVAIAVRLVFIIVFFLGASVQEAPLKKSGNWIFSSLHQVT